VVIWLTRKRTVKRQAATPAQSIPPFINQTESTHPVDLAALSPRAVLRNLVEMTRLRLNTLVLLTTAIGFLLANATTTQSSFPLAAWLLLLNTIIGTAICGCAGSVLNQWVERSTDHLMRRTADRPIPTGRIDPDIALWFGSILAIAGVLHLALLVNLLAAALALLTIILYSFIYTPMKYKHPSSTLIGAVPGALPPVIGWAGAHGSLSLPALVLFTILFTWQLPHFFAIGSKYRNEYAAAGIRILPVVDNENLDRTMRAVITWSIILALATTIFPYFTGMVGIPGLAALILINIIQLHLAGRFYHNRTETQARAFFLWTVIYLPVTLIILALHIL